MKNSNLKDLLINKLKVLYDVESELVKALPKMVKASSDPELREGFNGHLAETKNHVQRLEKIFSILEEKPAKLKSEAIRGLIADTEWVIKNVKPENAKDANLARAAQYVEHYEMAGYIGAMSWAQELGQNEIASLMSETYEEEKSGDEALEKVGSKIQKEISEIEEHEDIAEE
jgi:ferritin-like metal-binding protein YciE